jgi:mannitol-1-phosphate/altronate dehydrogenase
MAGYLPRRVVDLITGERGTAMEAYSGDRYRIEWDRPTDYQDTAKPRVPSRFFGWLDEQRGVADGAT